MLNLNETQTRKHLIDRALAAAGWDVAVPTPVGVEIPADGFPPQAWQVLKKFLDQVPNDRRLQ